MSWNENPNSVVQQLFESIGSFELIHLGGSR